VPFILIALAVSFDIFCLADTDLYQVAQLHFSHRPLNSLTNISRSGIARNTSRFRSVTRNPWFMRSLKSQAMVMSAPVQLARVTADPLSHFRHYYESTALETQCAFAVPWSRASLSTNRGTPRTSSKTRTHISATGCSARHRGHPRHRPAQYSTPARWPRLPSYKTFACPMSWPGRSGDGASPPGNDPANTLNPTCGFYPLIGVHFKIRERMELERETAASGTMKAVGAASVTSGREGVQSLTRVRVCSATALRCC